MLIGVGTFAVQLARVMGAEVTAATSATGADLARSLGADHILDYVRDDFTRGRHRFDLIFDASGKTPMRALRRILTPVGALVLCGAPDGNWVAPLSGVVSSMVLSPFTKQRLLPFLTSRSRDDLLELAGLLESGSIVPAIDRSYPLGDIAEALEYVRSGRTRGKVVVTHIPKLEP